MKSLSPARFLARNLVAVFGPRVHGRRPTRRVPRAIVLSIIFVSAFALALSRSSSALAQSEMLPLLTTISLDSLAHPDGSVTFKTSVTGRNGLMPNGSVKIVDETTQNLVAVFDVSDREIRVPQLPAGSHVLRAYYSGSDQYFPYVAQPSSSEPLIYNVLMAPRVDLAVVQNAGGAGELVTLTATVLGNALPNSNEELSGLVAFKDGDRVLATQRLDRAGQTSFVTTALEPGSHQIVAQYEGGETFAPAVSAARIVSVGPAGAVGEPEQRNELPPSFAVSVSESLDTN